MVDELEPLRVVIVHERGVYVAQCVDFDVAGHGDTADAARDALWNELIRHAMVATRFGDKPLSTIGPPPQKYRDVWNEASSANAPMKLHQYPAFSVPPTLQSTALLPSHMQCALGA